MGFHRAVLHTAAAAALAAALTACGSGGDADGPKGKDEASEAAGGDKSPVLKHYAAPLKFSTAKPIALPESGGSTDTGLGAAAQNTLPVTLHKGTAFIARPDGLEVASGHVASDPVRITPEHGAVGKAGDTHSKAPFITSAGGKTVALSALVTEVPGSGTSKGHDLVELMATDTANATKPWFTEIPLSGGGEFSDGRTDAAVVGRSGDTVVVLGAGQLFGVDINTHKRVWTAPGDTYATNAVVAGDRVVAVRGDGLGDKKVVGLNAATGRQSWVSPRVTAQMSSDGLYAIGPDTVMTFEYATGTDNRHYLLDATDGSVRKMLPEGSPAMDCGYDGASVTVCTGDGLSGDGSVAAYDAKSGRQLWKLTHDSADRIPPHVTLVRNGLLYGVTKNGPVVMDARTGQDKEDAPGIAPYASDGYVGLGIAKDDGRVTAYRATG
ncbi:PQQ-binding-like beta-propeller repeat protein [Streptomyces sp. NPDC021212]|uniref:outer membrane protein assembly factor BamB family protein n=1 Tax=Streptomyces sp. NPDC021212 TaxID=3365118 RepID=UPI00379482D6